VNLNQALLVAMWRQRLSSPVRVTMLVLAVLGPALLAGNVRGIGLAPLGDAYPFALLFAVGMIGQDVSSGVLQLVLARPVSRAEYVIHRWLGAAIAASVASLVQIGLTWVMVLAHGDAPRASTFLWFAAARELQIFGVAGTMALFSSLMNGVADLALYAMAFVSGGVLGTVGQFRHSQVLIWSGDEIGALVYPKIDLAAFASGAPPWHALATWASNLTLCLLLAILVMNRKELSYAAG